MYTPGRQRQKKNLQKGIDMVSRVCYLSISKRAARLFLHQEVTAMSVLEVLTLLQLLATVIFGILRYIKK